MVTQLESSIVRIFNKNRAVVGAGFLISSRHVITCAHVVADALGLARTHADQPGGEIEFDFPLIAIGCEVKATPVFWLPMRSESGQPDGDEDLAVLEATASLPPGSSAASLAVPDAAAEEACKTYGFPENCDSGVPTSGVLRGRIGGGCQLLESEKYGGYFARQGFSGAPVWVDQAVIGMIVSADEENRAAYLIPASLLIKVISAGMPELSAQMAIVNRTVNPHALDQRGGSGRERELSYLERLKARLNERDEMEVPPERFNEDRKAKGLKTDRYTSMSGVSQQRPRRVEMKAQFELRPMPIGKGREMLQESRRFPDAVKEIRRIRRAALLGDPGSGKTATILKLVAELIVDAERNDKAPLPLLIELREWTKAEPLETLMTAQLGDLGKDLDRLLTEKRAALLLDGLNELPTGQRATKYPEVKRFIERHRDLLAVISCRELDYEKSEFCLDVITIRPLDPVRIRDFVGRYLGEEPGERLFWELAGERTRNYHSDFIARVGPEHEETFWVADHLPDHLKWTDDWDTENKYGYWSGWLKHREEPSSLMALARNPYMLLMLTRVYHQEGKLPENRGELFRAFVDVLLVEREGIPEPEHEPLIAGLAKVAYRMQTRRAPGNEGDSNDAWTVLPKDEVIAIIGADLLYRAASASILNVGEQVRFTHQLLQEYFVARHMEIEVGAGRLKASKIWPPDRWWERTNWEEAAVLYAGLYSDDCSHVIEWVAEANPEVAAQCVVRSGAKLSDATRERLRSRWIARLTDLKGNPKPEARAAVGRALGLTGWDDRKGVGVSQVTLNGCSVTLPDIDWVEIPGGEFKYGDQGESDSPPQTLMLPTFHLSRYPVTYAQFQTFLDDPEGYADPRWFEGLAADDDERRIDEQSFKFANHPRETVNWYQAVAFCRWLSWRLGGGSDLDDVEGWAVRLPTEYEWEKAARGTDGRIYPYQGNFDAAKGNTSKTGLGQTSAVGIFPNGASPYGVMDLSGNVWEWCLSNYNKPEQDARRENLRTDDTRVLRGGSWIGHHVYARAAFRVDDHPAVRGSNIGFRLVVGRPPSR